MKPSNALRYTKGAVLEILTWIGVLISAPILLILAAPDIFALWDGGKAVLHRAIRLSRRARRYRIRPHNILSRDGRDPVLYLRAFSEDYGEQLEGFFPATPEEGLAAVYNKVGPVIAVGEPGEDIPLLGAIRIYFEDSTWQAGVLYLMSVSQFVIIQAGFAPGLLWELGVARQRLDLEPQKLIISFAAWDQIEEGKRYSHYSRFKKYAEELLGCVLPIEIGSKDDILFGLDWEPKVGKRRR